MRVTEGFTDNLGNVEQYAKQSENCRRLGWERPFKVFEAWLPNANLELLNEARRFAYENRPVTVRQIYYHLISCQLLTKKDDDKGKRAYNLVKRAMVRARNCGFININWIEDRTRDRRRPGTWTSMQDIQQAAVDQFRRDWMLAQPRYVEVWLEKRALENIFYDVTREYGVYLVPCGGNQSTAIMFESAENFKRAAQRGQEIVVSYFGDLNASGKNMLEDIKKRLALYGVPNLEIVQSLQEPSASPHRIVEVALNEADVSKYNLPRNPEKKDDTRARWFAKKYPNVKYSVELDALPPVVLREKLRSAIEGALDMEQLNIDQQVDSETREETSEYMQTLWNKQDAEAAMDAAAKRPFDPDRPLKIDWSKVPEHEGPPSP